MTWSRTIEKSSARLTCFVFVAENQIEGSIKVVSRKRVTHCGDYAWIERKDRRITFSPPMDEHTSKEQGV
jgi:hypothetical protein